MSGLISRVRINENVAATHSRREPRDEARLHAKVLAALAGRAAARAADGRATDETVPPRYARVCNHKIILINGIVQVEGLVDALVQAEWVSAVCDVGAAQEGGLLAAVGELLLAPDRTFGATLYGGAIEAPDDETRLLGGTGHRVLVAADAGVVALVIEAAVRAGARATALGNINDEPAVTWLGAETAACWPVAAWRESWERGGARALAAAGIES